MSIVRRASWWVVLLALACTVAASSALAEATPVVIAVGVNNSFDPSLAALHYAETDAERFAQTMSSVGDVSRRNVTLLRSPTVGEFLAAVRYQVRLQKAESGDKSALRLILYFSGHADERGLHFRDGPFSRVVLQKMLGQIDAATKILVIDSCFSGAIAAKGVTPDAPFDLPKLDMDELTGSVFLTASAADEAAYESEELSGGLFTHDLIAGLSGAADGNGDGLVTVDEVYQYVYRETRLRGLTYSGGSTQHPEYHAELHGHGALVLSKPRQVLGTLRVDPGIIGTVHLASMNGLGSFAVYGQGTKAQDFRVPEGTYRAIIRRGDIVGEASLMVARSETVELRAGQFTWNKTDMAPPQAARGTGGTVQASSLYMVAMREALGAANLSSVVAETSRELVSVSTVRARLTLLGTGGVEQSTGMIDSLHYTEEGLNLSLGVLLTRSDLAVRGLFGFGISRQWQHWSGGDGDDVRPVQTAFNPSAYFGALLPLGPSGKGNWSIVARREIHGFQDEAGGSHNIDQYLLGLMLEP